MPINFSVQGSPKYDTSLLAWLNNLYIALLSAFRQALGTKETGVSVQAINTGVPVLLYRSVTFVEVYTAPPHVLVNVTGASVGTPGVTAAVCLVSTTGFDIILNVPIAYVGNVNVQWIATPL